LIKGLTILNVLILLSLLLLPTLLILTAYNVAGVVGSIKLDNTTQSLEGGKFTLSSVLTIRNPGPFNAEADVAASVEGSGGTPISVSAPQLSVEPGNQPQRIPVSVVIDLSRVSAEDARRLASNSENFTIEVSAHAGLQPITSMAVEATAQVTWLPPIHNPAIGQPTLKDVTPTQITVNVPFTFENQSPFFAVDGEGIISLFNSTDHQVGAGTLKVSSQPSTKWNGSAEITLSPPTNLQDLLLKDARLKYRAEIEFTLAGFPTTTKLSKTIALDWGAPIENPKLTTSQAPVNSTHTRVTATLSFLNNNQILTIDGSITPKLVDGSGDTWVGKAQLLHSSPGEATSLSFDMVIPNSQLMNSPKLVLGVETQLGSTNLEAGSLG
jgi:hypothetical protein